MTDNRYRLIHTQGDGQDVFRKAEKFNAHADVHVYPGGNDTTKSHIDMATVSLTVTPGGAWTVTTRPAWRDGMTRPAATVVAAGHADNAGPSEAVALAIPQMNNGSPTLVVFAVPFTAIEAHNGRPWTFEEADAVKLGPPTVVFPDEFPATTGPPLNTADCPGAVNALVDAYGLNVVARQVSTLRAAQANARAEYEPARLAWESAGTDEPGDQNADSQITDPALGVTYMYWSLGPGQADGTWNVELIGRNASGDESPAAGIALGSCDTEAAAKAAAQEYENTNT